MNNPFTINIRFVSQEKLEQWHDEFCKPENRNKDSLPNIEYTYHEIYRELVRREQDEQS